MLGDIADLAIQTTGTGDDFPHRRGVHAVPGGSGLNGLFGVAIAAGQVGLKRIRDGVDILDGKPGQSKRQFPSCARHAVPECVNS